MWKNKLNRKLNNAVKKLVMHVGKIIACAVIKSCVVRRNAKLILSSNRKISSKRLQAKRGL
jgi:hypothetical protein